MFRTLKLMLLSMLSLIVLTACIKTHDASLSEQNIASFKERIPETELEHPRETEQLIDGQHSVEENLPVGRYLFTAKSSGDFTWIMLK
ncbi:hypothetical protein [Marinilactibacillus kalidii]|uniref:hypothetical protein n=1 Tax=Marinilactibacillus kalidii TaxID=2820274 RepID=UPI001ABE5E6C|nr:hypothetical protein [Marinilactibacillus kalidii]